MTQAAPLTENSVSKTLIRLTIPMIWGMIGMVIFNLVDTYFIGLSGTDQLAAISFTFPVIMLMGSISMGLGVGTSAVVSRLIGQGNEYQVKRQATDSLLFSLGLVTLFMLAGLFTIRPVFTLLGANSRLLELIQEYMHIWYIGLPFLVIPMVGNNVIRAAGNTVIPSMIMLTAACINGVLDPVLIFGMGPFPALGLKGAAIATVVARAGTLLASLCFLIFKFNFLTLKLPKFQELIFSSKEMLYVGIPAAVTQLITPVSMGIITRIVADFGKEAVAALGVGIRIEMFALAPVRALSVVLLPFVGQNLGAGKNHRIKQGIMISQNLSFIMGTVLFSVFVFAGHWISTLFSRDPQVIRILVKYLIMVSGGYGLLGIMTVNASFFNAIKKPFHSLALNLLRAFLLYIPLAFIFSRFFHLEGVFAGALASSVIAGIISRLWVSAATSQFISQ
jgi:putative MATE family efflux protein